MRIQPYSGTSVQRLLQLINEKQGTEFTTGELSFGLPQKLPSGGAYNTRVLVSPVDHGNFKQQFIFYNRLSISALTRLPSDEILAVQISGFPFSVHGSLSAINIALGLSLTQDEVEDLTFVSGPGPHSLRIKDGASLAWLPSEYDFMAQVST